MKRVFCTWAAIILSLLLITALAAELEQGFLYQIGNDGYMTVTAYIGAEADVIIPSQIAGRAVTKVGDEAFGDNSQLLSVMIPEGVVSIGKAAFQNCLNLANVSLPSSLSTIGESAFNSCAQLKQIVIPDRVTAIADSTFLRCLQLKDVTFPTELKSIGRRAFAVTGIVNLDLPFSLDSIGDQAFYGNRNLISVTLPNSIREIGEFAFFVCENLTSVILPAGLTSIASGVFDKCPKLEMVAIPMSVKHIMDDALYGGLLKPDSLRIFGVKGSEAENYARRAGLPFESVAAATSVQITLNEQDAAGKKLAIDLSSGDKSLQLQAVALPDTLWSGVEWISSSPNIAVVDLYGLVTGLTKGEATITATSVDGSGVQAALQLNVANLAKSISISGESAIPAKGKVTLKAVVLPTTTDNKNVEWSVSDSTIASINASGVVTASDVTQKRLVTVTAAVKDGSGVIGIYELTINPLVSSVGLSLADQVLEDKAAISIDLSSGQTSIQLVANLMPADAIQRVVWKSSSPKVASVSEDGLITGLKKGIVTISATSTDGTKKVAFCTINVANLTKQISISGETAVTAGKSITLKAVVLPETTDNRKVLWTSSDETAAKVNKSGVVTAKKVNERKEVTFTAVVEDGSGVSAAYLVTVYPEATEVGLSMDGQALEAKAALAIDLSSAVTSIQLSAYVLPVDAAQKVVWKSSDPRVASVDENGLVTGLKKGKTTITVTTSDGTKKRANCIVTVSSSAK